MFLEKGSFKKDPLKSELWNRGAYLSNALAHCGECHTPRNLLGGLKASMHFAGSREGPEGELAPNITPDQETGIGAWSKQDLQWLLETGMKPDADNVQGLMAEAIDEGYSHLPSEDLKAMAEYLASLPPIKHLVISENQDSEQDW
jgi:Cytochrome c, mono- and diheme variants